MNQKFERIVIHGCPGSGKSILARRLGRVLNHPVIELDALYHQPDWQPTPVDEFRACVVSALDLAEQSGRGWIVDGNYATKLGDLVRSRATTVIWFDLPKAIVMKRVVSRSLRRVFRREQLWNGNREMWHQLFRWDPELSVIRWAWTNHGRYHQGLTAAAAERPVDQRWVRISSQKDIDILLAEFHT